MKAIVKANKGFISAEMPIEKAHIYAYELRVLGNRAKAVAVK